MSPLSQVHPSPCKHFLILKLCDILWHATQLLLPLLVSFPVPLLAVTSLRESLPPPAPQTTKTHLSCVFCALSCSLGDRTLSNGLCILLSTVSPVQIFLWSLALSTIHQSTLQAFYNKFCTYRSVHINLPHKSFSPAFSCQT